MLFSYLSYCLETAGPGTAPASPALSARATEEGSRATVQQGRNSQEEILKTKFRQIFWHSFFRFGVCCIFVFSSSGASVNQNCSYVQNAGFPASSSGTAALTYNVQKTNSGAKNKDVYFLNIYF